MTPSEVRSGMWVIYKGEKVLVIAPFLNYVLIQSNNHQIKVNYSQIEKDEPEQQAQNNHEFT